jgi:SAM-dependent methyltransferase
LVVYDGYHLDLPDHCADLLFSYQFIEHLHPDDVLLHFQLAHRLLRPGGKYIFATPHRFSGPHDISRLFSDVPQGFHLKEWTYRELAAVVKAARFSRWHSYRLGRLRPSWAVNLVTLGAELALSPWPRRLRRKLSARLFTAVTMGVQK